MLCTDVALALGAAAFLLWRAAIALHARLERVGVRAPEAAPIDLVAMRDAEDSVIRAVASAASFEAGLHRALDLLRGELGARATRAFLVSEGRAGVTLSELMALQPGFHLPPRACAANESAFVQALRDGQACIDSPSLIAVPVWVEGRAVALLELTGIEMAIDAAVLTPFLVATQRALASKMQTASDVGSAADRFDESRLHSTVTPWSGTFREPAVPGGCAC